MEISRCIRIVSRGLAGIFAVAVGSYAAYVGVTWFGYGHPKPSSGQDADPLLDRLMPAYDVAERRHINVAASAEITFAVANDLDLQQAPIVRAIFRCREIILGSRPREPALPRPLLQQMKALGWGVLAEIPGREIVMSAVTQPWKANVVFRTLLPQEFAAFHDPGYVKIAWTLRADPRGPGRSVARHETRAVTTDRAAATRFRWYWSTLSPGIKVIRYVALGLVKSQAENRARESVPEQPLAEAPEGSVTETLGR
jgi:hypothetical protein